MTLNDYIADYLRDAQYKIALLSVDMDTLQDQGSYQYQKLYRSRLELAMFMDMLYEGKWLIRKGVINSIQTIQNAPICKIVVEDIGDLIEGDIIYIKNVLGMTQLNFNKYKVKNIFQQSALGTYTFELYDIQTNAPIDSSSYGVYDYSGDIVISWYNHLNLKSTWTEQEVIAEIEHLRYYHHLNEAPGINFTGHYLKIASTINGGGTGSGGNLPAGTVGQLVTYNSGGEALADNYDVWAGMNVGQTITSYFNR